MGLEALSRGAKRSIFVEQNKSAARTIRENIQLLQLTDRSELLAMDVFCALKILAKRKLAFDIIYIDPPYGQSETIRSVLQEIEKNNLSAVGGTLFFEDSSQDDELDYQSTRLIKRSSRRFGIARLYQMENLNTLRTADDP